MKLWTSALNFLREAPGVKEPAETPAVHLVVAERDELLREIYEQRIRITGLSKKLRSMQTAASTLKTRWPAIHQQVFPSTHRSKRKQS